MAPKALRWQVIEAEDTSEAATLPLTAALLEFADRAISFQTPGHRGGRSCRTVPRIETRAGDWRVP
jgi:hypothetical protein